MRIGQMQFAGDFRNQMSSQLSARRVQGTQNHDYLGAVTTKIPY